METRVANREWESVKALLNGQEQVTLGRQSSYIWQMRPDRLVMALARYRVAAALIGDARRVVELGCSEGIGARTLSVGRELWHGIDTDEEALAVARELLPAPRHLLDLMDARGWRPDRRYDAAVSLDVIEHVPADDEDAFMQTIADALTDDGVCVIGTPNRLFEHLGSPQSRVGHINLYDHARLHALMTRRFRTVQSFGMQDVALHVGHPDARHYLIECGVGPR